MTNRLPIAPAIVRLRALDVTPYRFGLWCSVGGGEPFANMICHRAWSDDGTRIIFGLDTHNGYSAAPDEEMLVVPLDGYVPEHQDERDAAFLASRPGTPTTCPLCGHTTTARADDDPPG